MNRSLIAQDRLAPPRADRHVEREPPVRGGRDPADVAVTGNTVIDALLATVDRPRRLRRRATSPWTCFTSRSRLVLVTTHRRESWGHSDARSADRRPRHPRRVHDVHVRAAHAPQLDRPRGASSTLSGTWPNVTLTEPLSYHEFAHVMAGGVPGAHGLRRRPGGGPEPRQAGPRDARDHRASGGGRCGDGPARGHRRATDPARRRPLLLTDTHGVRVHGPRGQPVRRRAAPPAGARPRSSTSSGSASASRTSCRCCR